MAIQIHLPMRKSTWMKSVGYEDITKLQKMASC